MIDDQIVATTSEICRLAGISKQRLGQLEKDGVVSRSARDQWRLIATVRGIFDDMRAKRSEASAADARWRNARARDQEIRTAQREHRLVPREEFDEAWNWAFGVVVAKLTAVPARCTRDLPMRGIIERELNIARTEIADEFEKQAASLEAKGKAA
jgi:phage terminase Nu1 subunit (DNA packaging protein)